MPGLELLDVAIGLVFLYLMISLIATVFAEFVEAYLKKRSANLLLGLREMLGDPGKMDYVKAVYEHPMIFSMFRGEFKPDGKNLPSYIPSATFATALLDVIAPDNQGAGNIDKIKAAVDNIQDERLKSALTFIVNKSGDNVDKLQQGIAGWYDGTMERVSGWYKRHAQKVTLCLGFFIAFAFNADTIGVSANLTRDRAMREAFVAVAQGYAQRPASADSTKDFGAFLDDVQQKTADIGLPIGWSEKTTPKSMLGWIFKLIGLSFTAAATSLGATFWFDLLKQLMNVRATAKPSSPPPQQQPGATQQP